MLFMSAPRYPSSERLCICWTSYAGLSFCDCCRFTGQSSYCCTSSVVRERNTDGNRCFVNGYRGPRAELTWLCPVAQRDWSTLRLDHSTSECPNIWTLTSGIED
ncbi:hypothetical protein EV356DRAFT_21613 [Viridothelium virens]|uniref:Uncharacterized protein n=1 Tax=Viridothelium virens TaxID=1048519 RepID=A0A6A6GU59_VIRVR|nr:hypothetical protein EV356DRAFT_21613 [Viridothelium virens]